MFINNINLNFRDMCEISRRKNILGKYYISYLPKNFKVPSNHCIYFVIFKFGRIFKILFF